MSFKFSPKIVTDGLVLYLDASNTKSYVSGSTIWYNLSNNLVNGSVINEPVFSSENKGCIVFDGINDYVTINDNDIFTFSNNNFSIDFWINFSDISNNRTIASQYNAIGLAPIWVGRVGSNFSVYASSDAVNWDILNNSLGFTLTTNTWMNITLTRVGNVWTSYKNGVQQSTVNAAGTLYNSTNNYVLAYRNVVGDGYHACKISNFKIYKNKGLSSLEIQQNYNTLKSRFGL